MDAARTRMREAPRTSEEGAAAPAYRADGARYDAVYGRSNRATDPNARTAKMSTPVATCCQ